MLFKAPRHASAVYAMLICPFVCTSARPSVCPSYVTSWCSMGPFKIYVTLRGGGVTQRDTVWHMGRGGRSVVTSCAVLQICEKRPSLHYIYITHLCIDGHFATATQITPPVPQRQRQRGEGAAPQEILASLGGAVAMFFLMYCSLSGPL